MYVLLRKLLGVIRLKLDIVDINVVGVESTVGLAGINTVELDAEGRNVTLGIGYIFLSKSFSWVEALPVAVPLEL